jgi:hypothetical protein
MSSDTNKVDVGVWTNWSKGKVLGATLTTNQRDGALLSAGIFSSRIATLTGREVLLDGKDCYGLPTAFENNDVVINISYPFTSQVVTDAWNYYQSCFPNQSGAQNCRTHIKPRLSYSIDRNATCPFEEKICVNRYGNLKFDSGMVNTHDDLGINSPPSQRFNLRSSGGTRTQRSSKHYNR